MMAIGVPALRIISTCFIPAALGIILTTAFQALGRGFNSLLISVLRQLVVLLPAAFILAQISLDAVWFSFPIAEVGSLLASLLLYRRLYRNYIKVLPDE